MNHTLRKAIVQSQEFRHSIKSDWKRYQEHRQLPSKEIRSEILESWEHSRNIGVDPFQNRIKEIISQHDLENRLGQNEQLLSIAAPNITRLVDLLSESETMLSIVDRCGTILHSCGDQTTIKRAEVLNIFDGGTWSEESAGTNAVGITLKTKKSAQVLFSEHFCEKDHDWYCVATPILAPFTKELLAIVNVAGSNRRIHYHTFDLMISETRNVAHSIISRLYNHTIQDNLFLRASMEGVEEAIFIVDSQKNIVDKNSVAKSHLHLHSVRTIKNFINLERFIDIALESGQKILKEEVVEVGANRKYICSISPITFQEIQLGAVIFLREGIVLPSTKIQTVSTKQKKQPNALRYTFDQIIGSSPAFLDLVKKAIKAASIESTLFLSGETGTGKEVFAQAIHQASDRCNGPFIAINCGAMPSGLLESELSGYEPGAFTGAKSKGSIGKFEMAKGGTIFLDEIGDMPLDLQVHLLRILEERVVTRIGGDRTIPIDVRIIAATHKNLTEAVAENEFREDLLYRLRVIQLNIPSLRERVLDIPPLVHHFIEKLKNQFGKQHVFVCEETMQCLIHYHWPGNIRELKNVIQQALFNMDGYTIYPSDLPLEIKGDLIDPQEPEKRQFIEALRKERGNITKAAEHLRISRATMYRKIKQYQLIDEDWKD